MTTRWRKFIKRYHTEGIPWPASLLYNALSASAIFRRHYELVAQDMSIYGVAESILDLNTGPGRLLIELYKVFPDTALVGLDISPAMIEQAEKNIRRTGVQSTGFSHLLHGTAIE
jgi:ubiquinone/menaquinone biosynthesis C-methylase UbiE